MTIKLDSWIFRRHMMHSCRIFLVQEADITETSRLIDRYKFMDAYPCTDEELRMLGYVKPGTSGVGVSSGPAPSSAGTMPVANGGGGVVGGGGGGGGGPVAAEVDDGTPRPDFSQMVPFKVRN